MMGPRLKSILSTCVNYFPLIWRPTEGAGANCFSDGTLRQFHVRAEREGWTHTHTHREVERDSPDSRHGLVDGLDPVAHGKLVHYFLGHVVVVDPPGVVPAGLRDFHRALAEHVGRVVEQILHRNREGPVI